MNIIRDSSSTWEASIRPCGVEFGGDHHLYIDFLDSDGRDCRDEGIVQIYNGSILILRSDKPISEPAINIPIWPGEILSASAMVKFGDGLILDSDTAGGITTSKAENGDLYHQSFHLVFRKRAATLPPLKPAPPTTEPTKPVYGDSEKQVIINILNQVIGLVEDLR